MPTDALSLKRTCFWVSMQTTSCIRVRFKKEKQGVNYCIRQTSVGSGLMEQKNKQQVILFCILIACVTPHWQLGLQPQRAKGVLENEQVQIEISIISCLISSQIAIFRQDKFVPSCFASFRLDCFILGLSEKVILWVVLANRVIPKWAITYTNMTQSSFWPRPHICQPHWRNSYLHDKDFFI